jgi:hypothetical protein
MSYIWVKRILETLTDLHRFDTTRIWKFVFETPHVCPSVSIYIWICTSQAPETWNGFYSYSVFKSLFAIRLCPENIKILKIYIFWVIMYCGPFKVNRSFAGICRLHLQNRQRDQARNHHQAGSKYISPKRPLTFNLLHGIISQKTELFVTTTVRISNPAWRF